MSRHGSYSAAAALNSRSALRWESDWAAANPLPLPVQRPSPGDQPTTAAPAGPERAGEPERAPCQQAAPPAPREVLHPKDVEGLPTCVSGWFSFPCPHHPGDHHARPELCGRQACQSSTEDNSLERARDAWEGTADKVDSRRGLRHFGDVEWAVFVFTLPAELRARAVGDALRKFRKAAGEMALEVLRRAAGDDNARFFARSWLHPCGDGEKDHKSWCRCEGCVRARSTYKPHENLIIPLVCWHPVRWSVEHPLTGKKKVFLREKNALVRSLSLASQTGLPCAPEKVKGYRHRLKFMLPKSWLGVDGWICAAWRERLVEIFGQWWPSSADPPATLPFYEWRGRSEADKDKRHALQYFGRTFPEWAGLSQVPLRPRALDAAHWKNRQLAPFDCEHKLPGWDVCKEGLLAGEVCPPRVVGFGDTPKAASDAARAGVEQHSCLDCCREPSPYLDIRRTMRLSDGRTTVLCPSTGPPTGPPLASGFSDPALWWRLFGEEQAEPC